MKWSPTSYVETVVPLITAYALIGHGVFHYPAGKPRLRISIFYSITFFIGFAIILPYTFNYVDSYSKTAETKLFIFIVYWHTLIMNCTGALSWYHYKKSGRIIQRMTAIDKTLKELGGDCCYVHCYRCNLAALTVQLILALLINGVDIIWVKNDKTSCFEMIWFSLVVHHPFHVSTYALLNFSMAIRQIIHRFSETNKILETLTNEGSATTSFLRQKKSQVSEVNSNVAERLAPRNNSGKYLVQTIKQVHLELCCISRDLNEIYGVQVLLQIAEYFILLTGLIYDLYLNYMITALPDRDMRISVLLFWLIVHFAKVAFLNYLCGKAVFEANKTSEIIHISNTKYEDPEFKDEISQFALQMIQDPLSFAPAGFFTLNNYFFKAMLGSITTYAVILIEMNVVSKL